MVNWRYLASFGDKNRPVVAISSDVIDYFMDLADTTDRIEMGGFVFGRLKTINGVDVMYFYDLIQAPNISMRPSVLYEPSIESEEEIDDIMRRRKYNILSTYHTHPSDSIFSILDLYSFFTEKQTLYEANIKTPDFLVTGGMEGYLMAYLDRPFFLYIDLYNEWLEVGSLPFTNYPEVDEYVETARRKKYPNYEEFQDFILDIEATLITQIDIYWESREELEKHYGIRHGKTRNVKRGVLGIHRPLGITPLRRLRND